MLHASVDMLKHLGHLQHANLIQNAIVKTICEDKIQTPGMYNCLERFKLSHEIYAIWNFDNCEEFFCRIDLL